MKPAISASLPATSSLLGLLGIVRGAVLLAAFLIDIPPGLNIVRLVLYLVGAMAVVVAVHQRQVAVSPRLAGLAATAAVVANTTVLLREILPYGPWHPFAGDNGLVLFY